MGQYAGFVARYSALPEADLLAKMKTHGITEYTAYDELSLVVGIVKGDSDGHALLKLRMCGFEDIRMLGQPNSPGDDFPLAEDFYSYW